MKLGEPRGILAKALRQQLQGDLLAEAVETDVLPLEAGIRCETPADDPLGDKRVTFSSPEMVSASLPDR